MNPFQAEYDLVSLFEEEPTLLDQGVPWVYNRVTFRTQRGDDRVLCEIEPASRILSFTWERSGIELVRLEVAGIASLVVEFEKGREALVATFEAERLSDLRLQFRPHVHVSWGTEPT